MEFGLLIAEYWIRFFNKSIIRASKNLLFLGKNTLKVKFFRSIL